MDGRRLLRRAWGRLRRTGGPTTRLDTGLGDGRDRAIVLLADADHPAAVRSWLEELPADRVTVLSVDQGSGIDSVEAALHRLPTQDALVVVLGEPAVRALAGGRADLFLRLAVHLRARGSYVVDRTVGGHRAALEPGRRDPEASRLVKEIARTDDLLLVTKRGRHALTIREEQVGDLLAAREPAMGVSTLEVRPAGRLESHLEESSYGPSRADPWPARLDYPEMTLRHYQGEMVSTGGMRLRTRDSILPESFRWPHAKTLRHPHYRSVTPQFVSLDRREPEEVLSGDYYYVDCLFSGHFGHLTTEVLCRLWGWDRARQEFPGLKLLFHTNPAKGADGTLERRLFTAYGVPASDVVSTDRPVQVRSVLGASPMWHNKSPFYAHPDIRETWARLTAGLLSGAEPSPHERIFVSRGSSVSHRRTCRNQHDVERFFADRGYHVCYPEQLPLPEQVRLFAGARVVAGFGGSALFNLMHCRALEAVVVISHHAYVARNEHLFASVLGGQLHYFWQESDVPPPEVGRNKASSGSAFAFDFAAYGDDLSRLLAGL